MDVKPTRKRISLSDDGPEYKGDLLDRLYEKSAAEMNDKKPAEISIKPFKNPQKIVYYKTDHFKPDNGEIEVSEEDIKKLDESFVPDGNNIGRDEIDLNSRKISRGYESIDVKEYICIFTNDPDDINKHVKWYKTYENGYINGQPVTRHSFMNESGTAAWDVKFYKGHSKIKDKGTEDE